MWLAETVYKERSKTFIYKSKNVVKTCSITHTHSEVGTLQIIANKLKICRVLLLDLDTGC